MRKFWEQLVGAPAKPEEKKPAQVGGQAPAPRRVAPRPAVSLQGPRGTVPLPDRPWIAVQDTFHVSPRFVDLVTSLNQRQIRETFPLARLRKPA